MKTKKIVWGFLITMIMIGCSTDDTEIIEKQVQLNAKSNDTFDQVNDGNSNIDPVDNNNETSGINENNIVTVQIKFLTSSSTLRASIRSSFISNHGILIIKSAKPHTAYETWGIETNPQSGSNQSQPEEDEPLWNLQGNGVHPALKSLKDDIKRHLHIILGDSLDYINSNEEFNHNQGNNNNNGSSNTDNNNNNNNDNLNGNNEDVLDNSIVGFQ